MLCYVQVRGCCYKGSSLNPLLVGAVLSPGSQPVIPKQDSVWIRVQPLFKLNPAPRIEITDNITYPEEIKNQQSKASTLHTTSWVGRACCGCLAVLGVGRGLLSGCVRGGAVGGCVGLLRCSASFPFGLAQICRVLVLRLPKGSPFWWIEFFLLTPGHNRVCNCNFCRSNMWWKYRSTGL